MITKTADLVCNIYHWLKRLPAASGIMPQRPTATVYTRQGCHLCEDAETLLREEGFEIDMIDVDANPELRELYDRCVPVVVIDGRERFRGRVDRKLLRRLVAAME